ncbi:MAG: hypothetical protein ACREF7_02535, partial [Candidatus Saccharimonadales bacterium]
MLKPSASIALLFVVFGLFNLLVSSPLASAATANNSINFQARLEQANGAIVADGSYNIEFNLYTVSSGGSTLWTEDWLVSAGHGVAIHNGYLTTSLGSLTTFPGTINWNQQLYLGMTVRGTTSCSPFSSCTPADSEMTPRLLLTAVPFSFSSAQLATVNTSTGYNSTLAIVQPTVGNQTFQIDDQAATGTYTVCIQGATTANGGCAPTTGGTGYIQNQNASAQASSNFWISGTGQAATIQGNTNVLTPLLDSISGTLGIGTTTATAVTIGNTSTTTTESLIATTTLNLGNNANSKTINIGTTGATANTTALNLATSTGAAQTIDIGGLGTSGNSNASTTLALQAGATTLNLANAGVTLQTFTNSPTAFRIQNTGGISLLTADTTNAQIDIGTQGTPTGQLYISGTIPTTAIASGTMNGDDNFAVSGNYVYGVGGYAYFEIYNTSNPSSPVETSSAYSPSPTCANVQAAVSGNYVYVACVGTIYVVNVSNPTSPSTAGSVAVSGEPYGIYVSGNYLYATTSGALDVFNVSNPTDPVLIGSVSLNGSEAENCIDNIEVVGDYAYIASTTPDFYIVNISNPASPTIASTTTAHLTAPAGLSISNGTAYISDFSGNDIAVFNVNNPSSPTYVTSFSTGSGSNPAGSTIQGQNLYVAESGTNAVSIINISNPSSPSLTGTISGTNAYPNNVAVSGRYLYVNEYNGNTFQIYDLGGTYTQSLQVGSTTTSTLQVTSNALVSGDENIQGGLEVGTNAEIGGSLGVAGQLGVSGIVPTYVGENSDSDLSDPLDIYVSGNYAYVTSFSNSKLVVYDISSGTPVLVGEDADSGNLNEPQFVYVSGKYAYVTNYGNNKLVVYNISTGIPVYVGSNNGPSLSNPQEVYVSGNYAYVPSANNLVVYNISSGTPVYVGQNSDTGNLNTPESVYVSGNYAYVTNDTTSGKLVVYNISTGIPVYVGENSDSNLNDAQDVYISGSYAYVASTGNDELVVYDIATGIPVYVGENSDFNLSYPDWVRVSGNYAYVVNNVTGGNLVVYNISSGTPVYVGENADSNLNIPVTVFVSGNYAYVTSQGNNKLISYSIGGTVTQSLQAGSTTVTTLQVAANAIVSGDQSIQGGLSVGTNAQIGGNLGISGGANIQGSTILSGGTNQLAVPAAPSVTPTGTAGSTSYSYTITAVNAYGGETT